MKKAIKKLLHYFFKGAYGIGYRHVSDSVPRFDDVEEFKVIDPTLHRWYADPFPFIDGEKQYIFVEILDDKNGEKGTIGVIDLDNEKDVVEIINEPFHMSFPNVFRFEEGIYMIPETSAANQLRLYKAEAFPYRWKLEAVLYDDISIVDTALLKTTEGLYAIGQLIPEKKNVLFVLDIEKGKAEKIKLTGNYVDKRPAGNFIQFADGLYHTLQECGKVYGEYLHVCKLNSFKHGVLDETETGTYTVKDMRFASSKRYRRVHTYNRMGNLEVIDLLYYQFNPTIIPHKIKSFFKKEDR